MRAENAAGVATVRAIDTMEYGEVGGGRSDHFCDLRGFGGVAGFGGFGMPV